MPIFNIHFLELEREKNKKFALENKKCSKNSILLLFHQKLNAIFKDPGSGLPILIVVGGPTASGKTDTALRLAQHFDTEIISADSRQFYREMNIGTAKPEAAVLMSVRHHFIDSLSVEDDYSVGDFEREALTLLDRLYRHKRVVIVAGGSGLFISALCEGLDRFPEIPDQVRQQVDATVETGGLPWLQSEVARLDPVYYAQVDRQNPARLRRAVEVCWSAKQPYSDFLNHKQTNRPFHTVYVLLEWPRAELYARIDARVDQMVAAGLEAEARNLLPWRHRSALRTVGYEEWFDCFDGKTDHRTAIEKIKQHSRNYAKRQITWFKKYGRWTAFHPADQEQIQAFCETEIKKYQSQDCTSTT